MAYIGQTTLMTFFFLPIFPMGVFISAVGLICSYLVEKYNLLRFYKRPEMINFEIGKLYFTNFKISILLLATSNFIFFQTVYKDNQIFWLVAPLIIVLLLTIFPFDHLLDMNFIGVEEKDIVQGKYEDFYFKFNFHYDRTNPFTKLQGNLKYVERLKAKNLISEEEYSNFVNEINSHSCEVNLIEVYYRNNNDLNGKNRTNLKSQNKKLINKIKNNPAMKNFKSLFKSSILMNNTNHESCLPKKNLIEKFSSTFLNLEQVGEEEKQFGLLKLIQNSQKDDCISNGELILNEASSINQKLKLKLKEKPKFLLKRPLQEIEKVGMIDVNILKSTIDKYESEEEEKKRMSVREY